MSRTIFYNLLQKEIARIDGIATSKRHERVVERFTDEPSPKAIIDGKEVRIFNSNDYLGFRFHPQLKTADHEACDRYGTGPGAVRFISGSLKIHQDLEAALAKFHNREAAMIFSSAFATNQAVMFCLLKGQSQDSVVHGDVLMLSDALNHRSIIDGIRLANLASEQKQVFAHLDSEDLAKKLEENKGKFKRVLVVTDGVFSMLGEYQALDKMRTVIDRSDTDYEEGVILVVDDAHGIGACGKTGRGTEEVFGAQADVLVGTMGKAFGADGGYVVGNQTLIDYLRESAATYIYSNSIAPGTASAALAAVELVSGSEGKQKLEQLAANVKQFKQAMTQAGFQFAAQSAHPIQPILIGDAEKCRNFAAELFNRGILVTNLSYPVVTKGRDEIRVQLSAIHTQEDLEYFISQAIEAAKKVGIF